VKKTKKNNISLKESIFILLLTLLKDVNVLLISENSLVKPKVNLIVKKKRKPRSNKTKFL
jgi:hypothetical protein